MFCLTPVPCSFVLLIPSSKETIAFQPVSLINFVLSSTLTGTSNGRNGNLLVRGSSPMDLAKGQIATSISWLFLSMTVIRLFREIYFICNVLTYKSGPSNNAAMLHLIDPVNLFVLSLILTALVLH